MGRNMSVESRSELVVGYTPDELDQELFAVAPEAPDIELSPWLSRTDGALGLLSELMNALGGVMILVIMVVILVDVLGRFLFSRPLPGTPEIVAMSIAAIVFMQFPNTLRAGRVISADGFLQFVGARSIRAEQALQALFHLCGGILFAIVAYYVWVLLRRCFLDGDYYGTLALFTFPKWIVMTVITLGCVVMACQYLMLAIKFVIGAVHGCRLIADADVTTKVVS